MTLPEATEGPTVVPVALSRDPYPVIVGDDLGQVLREAPLPATASAALVVTQEPVVAAGHVDPVEAVLSDAGLTVTRHLVRDGEHAKDAATLAELWDVCAQLPLTRGDLVVAVGGGVVGDLAGFLAATWNRGVAVLQVPTTLLAQVDAAIGGKTGINLAAGKNLVGAFHQPVAVACGVDTLTTLSPRVRTEGLGEVVKYGLIADPGILDLLETEPDAVLAGDRELLHELVVRSAQVKAAVVAADEREGGVRAHLNLGHTYGHAVETLTGYGEVLHGEAVAIGTVVALRLGERLGLTPPDVVTRGEAILDRLGLPTRGPLLDRSAVWDVVARDKKATRDGVRWIVLEGLAMPTVITPDRADLDTVLDDLTAASAR
ncbi:3-dehydroquinate synthase [Nitriliruptor alkaliphilus]|uniref:3-dehydroquinate synthase n=1 Tax=Nitriliruptor alkaliphilus TaxID=427918 RepID=UPI000697A422|nr:3-dehydroquinate synthase [Nitriliruptor alkaliphilus]